MSTKLDQLKDLLKQSRDACQVCEREADKCGLDCAKLCHINAAISEASLKALEVESPEKNAILSDLLKLNCKSAHECEERCEAHSQHEHCRNCADKCRQVRKTISEILGE
ncbi:hypothetical protein MIR68_011972 [Amoeboaphelidium protococcarum]|nr:hypothetical protein MIR68_011972 [Amoeboaphelidium protococcarum]